MNISEFSTYLQKLPKQYNYATAVTLTKIAKKSQYNVRKNLKKEFTLRNTWTERSIKIKPANKNDKQIHSKIYSTQQYIAEHEKGHTRTVDQLGIRAFAVPTKDFYSITGRAKNKKIPKSLKAKGILKRKVKGAKPFIIDFNNGTAGIMIRLKKAKNLKMLYYLTDKPEKIKSQNWFNPVIEKTYKRLIEPLFKKELSKALSTMR